MKITDISVSDNQVVTIDFVSGSNEGTFFVTGEKLLQALDKVARPNSSTAVRSMKNEPKTIKVKVSFS